MGLTVICENKYRKSRLAIPTHSCTTVPLPLPLPSPQLGRAFFRLTALCRFSIPVLFGTHSIAGRAILANTMALPSLFLIQHFPFFQLHYPGGKGLNTVPGSAEKKCIWWETRSCFPDSGTTASCCTCVTGFREHAQGTVLERIS